jgi:O-antigen ligase
LLTQQRISLAHISLALVGLMWVFPFLHYRHQYPLTTFDQEWWSALLGVLALIPLLALDNWRQTQIPRIVQLPAALIALVLLQSATGMMAYFDQALLYLLYLLFALLLMLLGANLRDIFGLEKLAVVLAVFLLVGAELGALIGVLQHYRWNSPFDAVVVVKVASSVYGNLAQPNHFANYTALGLISLGLLFQLRKLPAAYVALLAIPLLFVMTLSGSRSSWLYLLMISALSWWGGRRLRPLLYYCGLLLAGFAVMHFVVQLSFMKGASDSTNTLQRMFGGDASGGIRVYLWREAWQMFRESPWLGSGFGQFAWQHFQLGPVLHRTNLVGLYNNAHNLIFQLAAEAGIAGLTVLFASIGVWLYGLRRAAMSAAHWWGYAMLGVLAIHSLLEYPLWYAYFLAVAAILLGALDETRYRLPLRALGRMSLAAMLLLGLLSLLQLQSGYQRLKETLAIRPGSGNAAAGSTRDGLVAVHEVALLSPWAELFMSSYTEVNKDHLQAKLALNSRVIRFIPIAPAVYRQAFLLAQDGKTELARHMLEQAIWSYPANTEARQQLLGLAEKDPAHFAALLEFALQTEQEYASAIHNK